MTRTRALLLAIDYHPATGGIARLLANVVMHAPADVEWRVVTTTPGPDAPEVFRVHGFAGLAAALPIHARWLRGAPRAATVSGHVYLTGHALLLSRLAGTSVTSLVYGREIVPQALRHAVAVKALQHVGRIITISEHTAGLVLQSGVLSDRIVVVLPVFRPAWIRPDPPIRRLRGEGLRLVGIGRMSGGYKNFELLLRLAALLRTTGVIADLTIVGEGPRRHLLLQKADRLGAGDVVQLPGRLDDQTTHEVLSRAHLGVFPSRDSPAERGFEGFGLVVHELAAAGLPVLVGRAGGATEAARPEWSRLLDPDDLSAWADATMDMSRDEDARLTMGGAGAEWARMIDPAETPRQIADALLR